jgi:hypothetical protein
MVAMEVPRLMCMRDVWMCDGEQKNDFHSTFAFFMEKDLRRDARFFWILEQIEGKENERQVFGEHAAW